MTAGAGAREHAVALIRMGRPGEAAAAARSGLASEPGDPVLTHLLAVALCEAGDLEEALTAARQAVSLDPQGAVPNRTLGWVLYKQGRHAEAADQLAQALTLDPHDAETHIMRAEARLKQARRVRVSKKWRLQAIADAERHAMEATRLEPTAPGGYLMHGKVCTARSDAAGADWWARRALALEPEHPVGHQLLGLAAQLRGDTRTAADHYVDAGRLDPRSDAPMRMLRTIRTGAPIGAVALFLGGRFVLAAGGAIGGVALALAVAVVVGAVVYALFGARWLARRRLSDQARSALRRDRQLRRRLPRLR